MMTRCKSLCSLSIVAAIIASKLATPLPASSQLVTNNIESKSRYSAKKSRFSAFIDLGVGFTGQLNADFALNVDAINKQIINFKNLTTGNGYINNINGTNSYIPLGAKIGSLIVEMRTSVDGPLKENKVPVYLIGNDEDSGADSYYGFGIQATDLKKAFGLNAGYIYYLNFLNTITDVSNIKLYTSNGIPIPLSSISSVPATKDNITIDSFNFADPGCSTALHNKSIIFRVNDSTSANENLLALFVSGIEFKTKDGQIISSPSGTTNLEPSYIYQSQINARGKLKLGSITSFSPYVGIRYHFNDNLAFDVSVGFYGGGKSSPTISDASDVNNKSDKISSANNNGKNLIQNGVNIVNAKYRYDNIQLIASLSYGWNIFDNFEFRPYISLGAGFISAKYTIGGITFKDLDGKNSLGDYGNSDLTGATLKSISDSITTSAFVYACGASVNYYLDSILDGASIGLKYMIGNLPKVKYNKAIPLDIDVISYIGTTNSTATNTATGTFSLQQKSGISQGVFLTFEYRF